MNGVEEKERSWLNETTAADWTRKNKNKTKNKTQKTHLGKENCDRSQH